MPCFRVMLATRVLAKLIEPILRCPVPGVAIRYFVENSGVNLAPCGSYIGHEGHGIAGPMQVETVPRRHRLAAYGVPVVMRLAIFLPVVWGGRLAMKVAQPPSTTV